MIDVISWLKVLAGAEVPKRTDRMEVARFAFPAPMPTITTLAPLTALISASRFEAPEPVDWLSSEGAVSDTGMNSTLSRTPLLAAWI